MPALLPTLLAAALIVVFVYAMLVRKRWLESKALLADVTIRFETAQQLTKKSEQGGKAHTEQLEKLRAQLLKSEKQLEDIKSRGEGSKLEQIRIKTEHAEAIERIAAQKEHLLEQVQVITQQLSEAVREKKQTQDELNTLQREGDLRARQASEGLRTQLSELQAQLNQSRRDAQSAQKELEKFKQESGLVKPEELRRWQLKVARLEQLYASMKGLREMAEERNENWETALRYFAAHVLARPIPPQTSIGAVVGEALERIGATLVIDEISRPELARGPETTSPS